MIRHLLYSVYAKSHTNEWLLNIKELCNYKNVFNGRKLVIIRSDLSTIPDDKVKEAFDFPVEFVHLQNNKQLCEVHGFFEQFEKFRTSNPEEILFYAHTKGVKYPSVQHQLLARIRLWRKEMYEQCLGDIDKIEEILKTHACAGCFRYKIRQSVQPIARWHFSGSYYWMKSSEFFKKDYTHIPINRYTVEFLPSLLGFDVKEGYCLAHDNMFTNLYSTTEIFRRVKPKKKENEVIPTRQEPETTKKNTKRVNVIRELSRH